MLLPFALAAAALAPSALALDGFGVGMPHQVAAFINLLEQGADVPPDGGLQAAFVVQADGAQLPFKKPSTHDAHCFRQPVSHFADPAVDDHHADTFCQRYWYDASDYKAGGPVFVIDGGETSGANRLPFLDTGIVKRLAQEFDGLAVILEHRYYGESFPYWPNGNLSTDSLRFLNNAEALEDSADFIRHLDIKGLGHDIRGGRESGGAKWVYIGGSYAGARAAHMRVLYPELVYGAIASSAVTHAEIFYTDYMDAIRQAAPQDCMADLQTAILVIDEHLEDPTGKAGKAIKELFGLGELEDDDFAGVLSNPLGAWQARNWDPAVDSVQFFKFCDTLTAKSRKHVDGGEARKREIVNNYARWIVEHEVKKCPGWEKEGAVEKCFSTYDDRKFQNVSLKQSWRAWLFQVCTEWGYFQGAPLEGPRIVSKHLTLDYTSKICRQGFPKGEHFEVPRWPNVTVVNSLGDFEIAADRLAFVDGDSDPWRPATPGSDKAPKREDTLLRPSKLIPGGVHHWDENGLRDPSQEPAEIRKIHDEETAFVRSWLETA